MVLCLRLSHAHAVFTLDSETAFTAHPGGSLSTAMKKVVQHSSGLYSMCKFCSRCKNCKWMKLTVKAGAKPWQLALIHLPVHELWPHQRGAL